MQRKGLAMSENESSNRAELGLDELDVVAGGAAKVGAVELDGQVVEALPNSMFRVQLDDGKTVTCHLAGRLRMNYIRVVVGNRVKVEVNPSDPSRGRIVWRN